MSTRRTWQEIARDRKAQQEASIPAEWRIPRPSDDMLDVTSVPRSCGILSDFELEITETTDVNLILSHLASGKWKSLDVTRAFLQASDRGPPTGESCSAYYYPLGDLSTWSTFTFRELLQTNCLTEIFIERALARAKEVDAYLEREGKVMGPLHGLPVSLKDQFCMKGLETIMGYVSWVGNVADKDATIVEILYTCGAIPFVRTNVPQTLMWGETFNNVFGRTTNPFNRKLTPGGSSGGEGALIALRGSPLGIGTDIGGSVRIPAGFCELYSLRPSYSRLPYHGAVNSLEGQEAIMSVIGPMASHVSALKTFTKAVLDTEPWRLDPLVVRKPWSEEEYGLKYHGGKGATLCFGIVLDLGVVRPHPPVARAMRMIADAVKQAGHNVIEYELPSITDNLSVSEHIYAADGGEDYHSVCSLTGEPLLQSMSPDPNMREEHHPWPAHPRYLDEPFTVTLRNQGADEGTLTAYQLWALHRRKREIRKVHLDYWEATTEKTGTGRPVDALLCPVAPFAAPPHGLNSNAFYTNVFNFLDYACSTLPVTRVDAEVDLPETAPVNFHNVEDEAVYKLYSREDFENSPVGIQIVGRPQEEEAVIALTEVVDLALKQGKVGMQR